MLGYGSDFPYFTVTDVLTANPRPHYENMPMQYTAIFNAVKMENFQLKIVDILTHFSLASLLWVIGKQNSLRRGVPSGAILFAWWNFIEKLDKN